MSTIPGTNQTRRLPVWQGVINFCGSGVVCLVCFAGVYIPRYVHVCYLSSKKY